MYDERLDLAEVNRQVLFAEVDVLLHNFEGVFGLVPLGLHEEEEALVVEELPIVLDLVLIAVFLELADLLQLVLVVPGLAEVVEAQSLLALLGLLLLLWVWSALLLGK